MRFTEGDHTRGYLHGVLLDGAKPFLHRNGVRTLLGVADGGGSASYAPPPPPAGFQYVHRSDGRAPDTPGGDYEVVREYPERIVKSAEEKSIEEAKPSYHVEREPQMPGSNPVAPAAAPVPGAIPAPAADSAPVSMRTSESIPAPVSMPAPADMPRMAREPQRSSDAPMESIPPASTLPPAMGPRREGMASLEVPGVSRAVRDFPALRTTVSPEELQAKKEVAAKSPAGEEQPVPPAAQYKAPSVERMASEPAMPRREGEKGGVGEWGSGSVSAPSMPAREIVQARRSEVVEEGPYLEPADPRSGALAVRGALDTGRGGKLEQIVERVVARRVAEERAEWEDEPRRPQPPEQRVQVMVVGKPTGQPKIPCAFWERSYLHRFRIRTLR